VEGATVLYHVTGNQAYLNSSLESTVACVKRTSDWQGSNGLIREGQGTPYNSPDDGREFKGDVHRISTPNHTKSYYAAIWIRALTEIKRRQYQNTGLVALLKAYLNIQVCSYLSAIVRR